MKYNFTEGLSPANYNIIDSRNDLASIVRKNFSEREFAEENLSHSKMIECLNEISSIKTSVTG